jgi:glutamate carboxypeptidase
VSNRAALGVSPGAHAASEQIYFSSLMPRTYLCARLLETLD